MPFEEHPPRKPNSCTTTTTTTTTSSMPPAFRSFAIQPSGRRCSTTTTYDTVWPTPPSLGRKPQAHRCFAVSKYSRPAAVVPFSRRQKSDLFHHFGSSGLCCPGCCGICRRPSAAAVSFFGLLLRDHSPLRSKLLPVGLSPPRVRRQISYLLLLHHTIQFGLLLRPWDASRRPTDVSQYQSTAVRPLSCRSLDVRNLTCSIILEVPDCVVLVVAESVADPLPRPYHSSGFFSVITHRFAVSCCLSGYHRHESDGKGCPKLNLRFSDEICLMFSSLSEGRRPSPDALFCSFREMTVD